METKTQYELFNDRVKEVFNEKIQTDCCLSLPVNVIILDIMTDVLFDDGFYNTLSDEELNDVFKRIFDYGNIQSKINQLN